MLATNFFVFSLGLLFTLVAAAPTPIGPDQLELDSRGLKLKSLLPESRHLLKNMNQKLTPPRDGAVFWSGKLHGGAVAIHAAEAHAKKHGKSTLEMALKKHDIHIPDKHPDTKKLWKHASLLWASRAKGKTEAILGHVKHGGVYQTIEKPAILRNKKITQHVEHNVLVHPAKQRHLTPGGGAKAEKASSRPAARQKAAKKVSTQKAKAASAKPQAKGNGAKGRKK
jgi:hypothetical protein